MHYGEFYCLQSSGDGNISTSIVTFAPSKEHDQSFLSCRARNKLIDGSSVEDQWKITVHCKFWLEKKQV